MFGNPKHSFPYAGFGFFLRDQKMDALKRKIQDEEEAIQVAKRMKKEEEKEKV